MIGKAPSTAVGKELDVPRTMRMKSKIVRGPITVRNGLDSVMLKCAASLSTCDSEQPDPGRTPSPP